MTFFSSFDVRILANYLNTNKHFTFIRSYKVNVLHQLQILAFSLLLTRRLIFAHFPNTITLSNAMGRSVELTLPGRKTLHLSVGRRPFSCDDSVIDDGRYLHFERQSSWWDTFTFLAYQNNPATRVASS